MNLINLYKGDSPENYLNFPDALAALNCVAIDGHLHAISVQQLCLKQRKMLLWALENMNDMYSVASFAEVFTKSVQGVVSTLEICNKIKMIDESLFMKSLADAFLVRINNSVGGRGNPLHELLGASLAPILVHIGGVPIDDKQVIHTLRCIYVKSRDQLPFQVNERRVSVIKTHLMSFFQLGMSYVK